MDYYHSLLESYALLKRRKFKLSLREEEAPNDDAEVIALIQTLGANKTSADPALKNGVEVYQADPEENPNTFNGRFVGGAFANNLVVNGVLNPKKNKNAKIMINKLKGPEDSTDPDAPTGTEVSMEPTDEEKQIQIEQDKVVLQLDGLLAAELITKEELVTLTGQATGETKGTYLAKEEEVVAQMATMSEDKNPKEIIKSLKAQSDFLDIYKKYKEGEPLTPSDVKKLQGSIIITPNGIKMGPYYRQYRRKATPDNDAYLKMAEELDADIKNRSEKWNVPEEDNPFTPLERIEVPPSGGSMTANRGIIAEKLERVNIAVTKMEIAQRCIGDLADPERKKGRVTKDCPPDPQLSLEDAQKEVSKTFKEALKDHSAEEVMKMFDRGNKTRLGNYIANAEDMGDAAYLDGLKDILVNEHGMTKENAEALLSLGGTKNGVGLAVIIVASRTFSKELYPEGETMPTGVRQTGQEGAQELGEKADLIAEYDLDEDTTCEEIGKVWESKLSDSQKSHYKQAEGCNTALGGIGSGQLVTEGDNGKCEVRQELKVVQEKDAKVSYGESSMTRSRKICNDDKVGGEQTATFLKVHAERMKCFSSEGAEERACAFQRKIDEKTRVTRTLLNLKTAGSSVERGDNDVPEIENASQEYVKAWARKKAGDTYTDAPPHGLKTTDYERYTGCMDALNNPTQATKKQKDHLKKVSLELEQAQLDRMIPDGKLKGEHLDYICNRMSLTGGSLEETVKVGRKLEDRIQTVGLNNAEIYGTIAGLNSSPPTMKIIKKGNTYAVADMEGERRFDISMERGRLRLICAGEVSHVISKTNDPSEPQEENLLMAFLQGQQNLLEKLIDQTT